MKNLLLAALVIVVSFFDGFAQETATKSSLLWEVTGKKVKSPSYVFGTMHMMPKEDFYYPESLQEIIANSDILVMEIGGIAEQMKGMQLMMLEDGNLFDDFFTKEQLDSLFNYTEAELDMDESKMRASFSKMKPFVLLQLLSKNVMGENPESYEMSFEALAREKGIKIDGLETIEEQLGFITGMENDQQVNMIMSTIRNPDTDDGKNSTQELIEVFLSQDIDAIHAFIKNSDTNSEDFEETFLNKRNRNWIKPIKKIIRKNKAFIAVGAGHLGGEQGVIELLRKEGYTLTPVKF